MIIPYDSLMKILEHSFDGIRITDGKGRILYANTANAALLGVSKRDLEGKTTQELLDEHIFSDSVILRTLKTGERATHTSHNYCTGLDVLATATPILDRDGNIQYIVNNVRDVTALSRMRDSLRDYDEVIRIQKKQIDEMRSRYGLDKLIAHSQLFRKVIELAHRVAPYDGATVLILGESSTGKERIAETIVENSPRKGKPFIRINCGAIPENLLESELFGYEKGAFTGADSKGKKGLFEAQTPAPSFSTRSARCRCTCRSSCCASCSRRRSPAWAAHTPFRSMCTSSLRPTAICGRWYTRAPSAKTCTIA